MYIFSIRFSIISYFIAGTRCRKFFRCNLLFLSPCFRFHFFFVAIENIFYMYIWWCNLFFILHEVALHILQCHEFICRCWYILFKHDYREDELWNKNNSSNSSDLESKRKMKMCATKSAHDTHWKLRNVACNETEFPFWFGSHKISHWQIGQYYLYWKLYACACMRMAEWCIHIQHTLYMCVWLRGSVKRLNNAQDCNK